MQEGEGLPTEHTKGENARKRGGQLGAMVRVARRRSECRSGRLRRRRAKKNDWLLDRNRRPPVPLFTLAGRRHTVAICRAESVRQRRCRRIAAHRSPDDAAAAAYIRRRIN
uniref:Uncharacterized protein n=1 Tax=Plectus sambesii TaxID=2011161 RepID=A0A914UU90_9BILA